MHSTYVTQGFQEKLIVSDSGASNPKTQGLMNLGALNPGFENPQNRLLSKLESRRKTGDFLTYPAKYHTERLRQSTQKQKKKH
jgi:hypothetical protein